MSLWDELADKDDATIVVVGDTHGTHATIEKDAKFAETIKADLLVVVGDFGYGWKFRMIDRWNGRLLEDSLNVCNFSAHAGIVSKIPVAFIDGNHENFDHLDLRAGLPFVPNEVAPNCWHIPRGTILDIAGRTVVGFGGAVSVDRQWRTEGTSWWPQEAITTKQVEDFQNSWVESGRESADVLLTHAETTSVYIDQFDHHTSGQWPEQQIMDSRFNRKCVDAIRETCNPQLHLHGHMHFSYTVKKDGSSKRFVAGNNSTPFVDLSDVSIMGLDRDGTPRAMHTAVLHLNREKGLVFN